MKTKRPNASQMWKQFEDLAPRMHLSIADRTVYSYLLRHSRLEGRRRIEFSLRALTRGTCVSLGAVRPAVRRLITRGVLILVERSKAGHVVEVRTPEEIATRADKNHFAKNAKRDRGFCATKGGRHADRIVCATKKGIRSSDLEELNFLNDPARRRAIHARERGRCFYCLGDVTVQTRSLDHVVPRVELVDNTYRNLVSCCKECNSHKSDLPAPDYLCRLHRQRRLTASELTGRLRAVDALATGKLRPRIGAAKRKLR